MDIVFCVTISTPILFKTGMIIGPLKKKKEYFMYYTRADQHVQASIDISGLFNHTIFQTFPWAKILDIGLTGRKYIMIAWSKIWNFGWCEYNQVRFAVAPCVNLFGVVVVLKCQPPVLFRTNTTQKRYTHLIITLT